MPEDSRNMIFVSHAGPEDNEFTRWLALRLAAEGYPVWCDLTKLLGGEQFWNDIEAAIRTRSVKFLYVLSRTSNVKDGPRKELEVARNVAKTNHLKDFVIPLKVDDLPHSEINIQLHDLNAISFDTSWVDGTTRLVEKLELDGVSKNERFSRTAVGSWWRTNYSANAGIKEQPSMCLSNWLPIRALPQKLFFHEIIAARPSSQDEVPGIKYPVARIGKLSATFAPAKHFTFQRSKPFRIFKTHELLVENLLKGQTDDLLLPKSEIKKILSQLLVDNWNLALSRRGMMAFEMANRKMCLAFPNNATPNNRVTFKTAYVNSWRQLVGVKGEDTDYKTYWHFGVSANAMFYPQNAFAISPHVLFSDDGNAVWTSPKRLHRARRSLCKNWWNEEFRDRMLATMFWISEGSGTITIDTGDAPIEVASEPMAFESPVTYTASESLEVFEDIDRDEEDEIGGIVNAEAD
jgi:hypothetical protein